MIAHFNRWFLTNNSMHVLIINTIKWEDWELYVYGKSMACAWINRMNDILNMGAMKLHSK